MGIFLVFSSYTVINLSKNLFLSLSIHSDFRRWLDYSAWMFFASLIGFYFLFFNKSETESLDLFLFLKVLAD